MVKVLKIENTAVLTLKYKQISLTVKEMPLKDGKE